MKFYSFGQIKAAGDCRRFVQEVLGAEINREGRCQAIWRGGDGWNVKVDECEWYDHVKKTGGGIVELCAEAKFNGDIQQAQQFLGEWLGLEPEFGLSKNPLADRGTRYERLINEGYSETKRYLYEDLEGKVLHHVSRMEHDTKHKEFVQGTPQHWGLGDTVPILYRMKDWVASTYVCIVEGEKDVDTLIDQLGIPATTNCGGADKWRPEYAIHFEGKNVAIIRDNDEVGQKHAERVASELKDAAAKMVIICPSQLDKGDVTDWVEKEDGSRDALMEMIKASPPLAREEIQAVDHALIEAKKANERDITNYWLEKKQIGNESKQVKVPKKITAIIKDIHRRFMGFPRRIGDSNCLFDHDRNTGDIKMMRRSCEIAAWMMLKSKQCLLWARGEGFPTKEELFSALEMEATTYQSISQVPEYPKRSDVYYAHNPLPKPDPEHKYFEALINFFLPATPADRTLIKAFFCTPMWYRPGIPKPLWISDSTKGRGCGKSKIVEAAAALFKGEPLSVDQKELKLKSEEITKRLVSSAGRLARIFFIDNAVDTISSPKLASWLTAKSISGRAPYGRGEETRPNNLTYVISSNSATVDDDIAVRAFIFNLDKPQRDPNWLTDLFRFIEENGDHILADIYDILSTDNNLDVQCRTRFPEFEREVLQRVCVDEAECVAALEAVDHASEGSNVDKEVGVLVDDVFRERLMQVDGVFPAEKNYFVTTQVVKMWLKSAGDEFDYPVNPQAVKNLAKNGHTKFIQASPDRKWGLGRTRQYRGFLWAPFPEDSNATIIILGGGGKPRLE